MARQTLKSVSLTADARDQLNENFTELYTRPLIDIIDVDGTGLNTTGQPLIWNEQDNEFNFDTTWTDLRFPVTASKLGVNDKPDFDFTNVGLLFPQNDTTEYILMFAQFPHSYKHETGIHPHVHFVQTSASVPVFKLSYRWYKNGDVVPSFTTITTTGLRYPYTSGSILQVAFFPEILGTGIDVQSSCLDMKLYREDNVVTGDVLVKEFDIHYQSDTVGSRTALLK